MVKHIKRNVMLFVFSFIMLCSFKIAFAEMWENCGMYNYIVLPDGTAEITQYTGSLSNVEEIEVPDEINGLPVTSIGRNAFGWCVSLKKIVIPEGVTQIGEWAFQTNRKLISVILPDSVEIIDYYAFCECSALKEIELPSSLKTLGDGVFMSCGNLEFVAMPDGLESIGDMAFCDCDNLKELEIPSSVISIGDHAFYRSFNRPLVITVSVCHNSFAEGYCIKNRIPYEYID